MMSKLKMNAIVCAGLTLLVIGARVIGQTGNSPVPVPSQDVILTAETIRYLAVERAKQGNFTRIHQIDIVEHIYYKYRNDVRIVRGNAKIIIPGLNFASANEAAKPFFKAPEKSSSIMKPVVNLPAIKYQNFKGIGLYNEGGKSRMSIELTKGYTQEIPYTFGANIKFSNKIRGTLRSTPNRSVTEVVFDNDKMVHFYPPAFVFFIPKMYVKVASIRREGGDIVGYVVGRPLNMPNKYCAVRYNLTSCSKTSIKNFKMPREKFLRKVNDVSNFDFLK